MVSTTVILGIVAAAIVLGFILACCLRKKCMLNGRYSQKGSWRSKSSPTGKHPRNLPRTQESLPTQPFDSVDPTTPEEAEPAPQHNPGIAPVPICERNKNCNPSSGTCDDSGSQGKGSTKL